MAEVFCQRGLDTVEALAKTYLETKAKHRSIREITRIFAHDILPAIGQSRADEVSRADVSRLLDKIAKRSPSVAHAVRRQLSAFYTWALPRLPDTATNPVASAAKIAPLASRDRVLTDDELRSLWAALEGESEPWRPALRLLILTGQRKEEVLQAEWREFDLTAKTWTIPRSRAKNGVEHIVPLSPAAISILDGLSSRSGKLFPKGKANVSRAAKRIRASMGEAPDWRWHDIRRTVATGLQRLGIRSEVTEAILNHVSGSKGGIAGVYQRHNWAAEKRDGLERWADELARIVDAASLPQTT